MSTVVPPEVEAIQKAWEKHILGIRPPRAFNDEDEGRDYFYAGSWKACLRRMVYEAQHPSYFPDYEIETKARFIRGEQREIDLRQALERVGQLCMPSFTVEGQQERVFIRDRKGRKVISGKKDCVIRWQSGTRWSTEFKSWAPFLTDRIFTFNDLMNSPYTKSGAMQLLAYLYGKEEPYGLLVLDRPGLPRLVPVRLEEHYDLMTRFLDDAETGRDHIEAGTLPDFHTEPGECRRCPVFGSYCNPPLKYKGATIITDDEILAKLEIHENLDEPRSQYADVHDELAEYLKARTPKTFTGKNKQQIIAGKFLIKTGWGKNTTTKLPETESVIDIKPNGTVQLKEVAFKQRFQHVDESGKFSFSIEKVSE